jgi:hypothetical protein
MPSFFSVSVVETRKTENGGLINMHNYFTERLPASKQGSSEQLEKPVRPA